MPHDAAISDSSDSSPEKKRALRVQIDNQPADINLEGIASFGELMARIEKETIPEGRVVTSVVLNEEALSLEQEELLHGFAVAEIGSLSLETAEPKVLALESLIHAGEYLPDLAAGLETIPTLLRAGRTADGLQRLETAFDIIQHFLSMLEGVRSVLKLDFTQVSIDAVDAGSLAALHAKLMGSLKEVNAAAEQEDWSHAGEIAGFELSPLMYQFMAVMPSLLEQVIERTPELEEQFKGRIKASRDSLVTGLGSELSAGVEDLGFDVMEEEEWEADADDDGSGGVMAAPGSLSDNELDDLEEEWLRRDQGDSTPN